ncbi:S8 family serine peptidase, partial [Streptomyces spiralis]
MAHLRSRRRLALAVPVALSLTASLGFLPAVASASPRAQSTATETDAASLSYVVNVRPGHGVSAQVKKAIATAGGTIVTSYDQIGVIVVHSADPGFAKAIRRTPGVESAGATRTAPLPAQSTTDLGTPKALTAAQVAEAGSEAADGQDPLEPLQWDLPAIKADKAHEKTLGSPKVTVAVIDTGVDDTHPDIAPNFDRAASVNCVAGKPDTTDGAWRPSAAE